MSSLNILLEKSLRSIVTFLFLVLFLSVPKNQKKKKTNRQTLPSAGIVNTGLAFVAFDESATEAPLLHWRFVTSKKRGNRETVTVVVTCEMEKGHQLTLGTRFVGSHHLAFTDPSIPLPQFHSSKRHFCICNESSVPKATHFWPSLQKKPTFGDRNDAPDAGPQQHPNEIRATT